MPVSTIHLTFEGMLVLFAKDGITPADAGLLKTAHGHDAKLLISEIPQIGAPKPLLQLEGANVNQRYELMVRNPDGTRPPKIKINKSVSFVRKPAQLDLTDFGWVLDYVGSEMYKRPPVDHNVNEFRSFLRMNSGSFYTQELSKNELVLKRPGAPPDAIGRVAVKIRSEIQLLGSDVATFSGSGNPITLTAQDNINYGLYFGLVPEGEHPGIDAENYHRALAINKPDPLEKIHFDRDNPITKGTPDAACFSPTNPPPGF